jgi:hypothetical protein
MHLRLHSVLLLALFALGTSLDAQTPSYEALKCIVRLEIPTYTPLARGAEKTGTVDATIHLNPGSLRTRIDVHGPDPKLEDEVRAFLEDSLFTPECKVRRLRLLFTYILKGSAVDSPPIPAISFEPPNRFIVATRPLTSIRELAPPPRR